MDALDAVMTKIEVREFSPEEVPYDVQKKVLEAGRMAASAYNRQPWFFILINDKDLLKKVAALATTGPYISKAAFAVAVFVDPNNPFHIIDGTRAVQNMMIAAWSLGLGSVWVAGLEREKITELLKVPRNLYLLTVIPFGKPAKNFKGKKTRKSLKEIAYLNYYGNELK
ncbi:MAG: nitroreductase family protein [Nitrososphaeria archaeon]|jgi:Nitroreductase